MARAKKARESRKKKPAASKPRVKRARGGSRSKRIGTRYEHDFIAELAKKGIDAERVPLSGAAGGRFGSDVMVFPAPLVSFSVEVKYRSSLSGFVRFLKSWESSGFRPANLGPYKLMLLEDFPAQLGSDVEDLDESVPGQVEEWMSQARNTLGIVAIRFPQRSFKPKWLLVIDDSCEQSLISVPWSASQRR